MNITPEFKVHYGRFFFSKHPQSSHTKTRSVNASFFWNGHTWLIPDCYLCEEGVVLDLCIQTDGALIRKWIDDYALDDEKITETMDDEIIVKANPMHVDFTSTLIFENEHPSSRAHSCSVHWIPDNCLPDGMKNDGETSALISHYHLDPNEGWSIHRISFPWPDAKIPHSAECSFSLRLSAQPAEVPGPIFSTPDTASLEFIHPLHATQHTLTVLSHQNHVITYPDEFASIMPPHYAAITYQINPPLSDKAFLIRDTVKNDAPLHDSKSHASSVAVIRGKDGPTSVILPETDKSMTVHSALHHTCPVNVNWQIFFYSKPEDDLDVPLQ